MATLLILDFNGSVSLMLCVAHILWIIEQFFFRCIAQCASCPSRASTLSDTCSFLVRLFFVFALWLAAHKLWFHQMSSMGRRTCNCISFLFCRIWKFFCVRRVTSPPYGCVGGNSGGRVRITFEITNFTNNPISVISYYHLYC